MVARMVKNRVQRLYMLSSVGNRNACMTVGFAHADASSYVVIRGNSVCV
jgi:hypothetical protein